MRFLTTALIVGVTAACSSTGPENSTVSMNVEGASWSAEGATLSSGGTVLFVSAEDPATDTGFDLAFDNTGTGAYVVGTSSFASMTYNDGTDEWATGYGAGGSGVINVTRVTSLRVAGTFSGELIAQSGQSPDTLAITNGQFEVRY